MIFSMNYTISGMYSLTLARTAGYSTLRASMSFKNSYSNFLEMNEKSY